MRDILTQFDLEQCVRDPTHKSGHITDWVLQRKSDPLLHSASVESLLTSDHMSIVCTMNVFKPKCPPTVMFCCKLKAIDTDAFHTDLSQILTYHPDMTVTELDAHITSFLNKHAPVTKYIQKKRKENNALVYSEDSSSQKRTPYSRTSLAEVRSESAKRDLHSEKKKRCSDTPSLEN